MANANTSIEWTDATWSPVTGCTKVSAGCKHCYAEGVANRFFRNYATPDGHVRQFTEVWTHPDRLEQPLRWRKAKRIFVNSMSDLFHEDVPFEFIDKVFAVMALTPQHTYQVLTKRPERMREYMVAYVDGERKVGDALRLMGIDSFLNRLAVATYGFGIRANVEPEPPYQPAQHVWLGVSVEDQKTADARIPILLQTPAAIRFVSYEPALGPVDFAYAVSLDWLIIGGESGPGARPFNLQWARDVVAQCKDAKVPVFVKQLGAYVQWDGMQGGYGDGPSNVWPRPNHKEHDDGLWRVYLDDRKGGDMSEWPEDLRRREFPVLEA